MGNVPSIISLEVVDQISQTVVVMESSDCSTAGQVCNINLERYLAF